MKFKKWRKELLFFILSAFGAGSSSLVASNKGGGFGSLRFQSINDKNVNNFIYSVGENSPSNGQVDQNGAITPENLLKNLSLYSSSIPLLIEGFAIQTAKQIFNKTLFQGTTFNKKIQDILETNLKEKKEKIDKWIENWQNNSKRIKKRWIQDDRWYLSALKNYLLSKIDEKSILDYFEIKDHLMKEKKVKVKEISNEKFIPLLPFFMKAWIQRHKAGFYVHKNIPYSQEFTEKMKKKYQEKYKDIISLPQKPNYYFPDYAISEKEAENNEFKKSIEDWEKGRNYYSTWSSFSTTNRDEALIKDTKLLWINKNNNSHKNIALNLLSEENKTQQTQQEDSENIYNRNNLHIWYLHRIINSISSIFTGEKNKCNYDHKNSTNNGIIKVSNKLFEIEKNSPMNLFCLEQVGETHPEFLLLKAKENESKQNISQKIIFYRDHSGFNLIYPISLNEIIQQKESKNNETEDKKLQFLKDSNMVNEFKNFIKDNFSQLLLKYRLAIKHKVMYLKSNNSQCCCDEIIKNLLILLQMSKKLLDWNEIWKSYDIRKINNNFLQNISNNDYFKKLGTISPNPPAFLTEQLKKDLKNISELAKPIKEYMNKIQKIFSQELKAEKQTSKIRNKDKYYWSFMKQDDKLQQVSQEKIKSETCIKNEVAEFLFEKISKKKLIKNFLSIPIAFKSSLDWTNKENSFSEISQTSTNGNNEEPKNFIGNKFADYFQNFLKNENLNKKNGQKTPKLIEKLIEIINKELTLSEISEISDTTLFNLLKKAENQENILDNKETQLENIENYLTLINLNNPKKNRLHEKLKVLITSLYLMENSFEKYREWIREIIKKEGFGAYAFSLNWNKFCENKEILDPMESAIIDSFWTPLENISTEKEWSSEKFDSRQCINLVDRYSSTTVKKQLLNNLDMLYVVLLDHWFPNPTKSFLNRKMMGFKGIVSSEMANKLPTRIYEKIGDFLNKEGYIDWKENKKQIDFLTTNRDFYRYINKLENIYPQIKNAFNLPNLDEIKKDLEKAKETEPIEYLNLKTRKELLKKFIEESILKNSANSQQSQTRSRFQGLMKNNEDLNFTKYIFDSEEEDWLNSASYLIQITTKDVNQEEDFLKFANTYLTPEMLLQDVVKQARIGSLQTQAINHFLHRGKWANGQKVDILKSSDVFFEDQFTTFFL
ncbi:DUF3713 domain-containing protein [Mycoplasma parvum]|uniref:DUF3713 domain-containing protein n=1 Tax=Mycoplasma parvum TaxID=984991 RepID=UPI0005C5AC95|nr:DUF3713 domain-containing protein [Mycoplasma parvum]